MMLLQVKFILCASICMASLIQFSVSDSIVSSKAKIIPVKLFHINYGNASSTNRHKNDTSPHNSVGRISRIIPMKRLSNGKYAFKNFTKLVSRKILANSTWIKPALKRKSLLENETHKTIKKSGAKLGLNSSFKTTTPSPLSTTTFLPSSSSNSSDKDSAAPPIFFQSKSWNHLNSLMKDTELRNVISRLSYEVVKNASSLTKKDPQMAEDYLLGKILSEWSNMKKSRMLDLGENAENKVNSGVRYSAKRKPVLNIIPLYNKTKENLKDEFKKQVNDHRNVSGHLRNVENTKAQNYVDVKMITYNSIEDKNNSGYLEEAASGLLSSYSTPNSLMHVLVAPEFVDLDATTFSPSRPSQSNSNGFVPVIPMLNPKIQSRRVTTPVFFHSEEISSEGEIEQSINPPIPSLTGRKARGPPKEEEYQLPSLTTSSTTSPPESSSYQTITDPPTPGTKIVWYHHNQTPNDTFFPNADNFLVPPEEASLEIIKDLALMKPVEDFTTKHRASFSSPYSSSSDGDYSLKDSLPKRDAFEDILQTPIQNDLTRGSTINRNQSTIRNFHEDKKNTNVPLQPQETIIVDHDEGEVGFKDYFPESHIKDGRRKPIRFHEERKHYGSPSASNDYNIKHHEFIPRYQDKPNSWDDTVGYVAMNELDHYDSYPYKHEIGPAFYRQSSGNNYHKIRNEPSARPYRGSDGDGRYHDGSDGDSDNYSRRPYDKDRERHKENSQGGWGHHHHGNDHYGPYGKDPHKDFFAKAKEYFKNSDFSTSQKWFDVSIGILSFLAFGGYIIMLLYQVFTVSSATPIGGLIGKSFRGAGEMFDLFFAKGPIGQAYMDELESIVKRAMANVKREWSTNTFVDSNWPAKNEKGETETN